MKTSLTSYHMLSITVGCARNSVNTIRSDHSSTWLISFQDSSRLPTRRALGRDLETDTEKKASTENCSARLQRLEGIHTALPIRRHNCGCMAAAKVIPRFLRLPPPEHDDSRAYQGVALVRTPKQGGCVRLRDEHVRRHPAYADCSAHVIHQAYSPARGPLPSSSTRHSQSAPLRPPQADNILLRDR